MKPGKELDALVAEHVLGWGPREINHSTSILCKWRNPEDSTGYNDYSLPSFSSDIAAAWELVEKLKVGHREVRSDGCVVKDSIRIEYRETTGSWFVCWAYSGWNFMEFEHWTEGESAPHAICLAALKTVGYG